MLVRISSAGRGSIFVLTQSNMKTSPIQRVRMHLGCQTGRTFFLVNLKAYLEHGIDLRGSNPRQSYRESYINSRTALTGVVFLVSL